MPELPDIDAYVEALKIRLENATLESVAITSPFLLRSVEPAVDSCVGAHVSDLKRLGKRIAVGFDNDHWLVLHLMIAGRLRWFDAKAAIAKPSRNTLADFRFSSGCLRLTEAGSKKRASLHVVASTQDLGGHDPGGLELLTATLETFAAAIRAENRTLKRALTDPRILSGIGNAYSDEILHLARLSPITWTSRLDDNAMQRLFRATQGTLRNWRDQLVAEATESFPSKVTAFRPDMRVHGKFGEPCPACGTKVQRIRYASNETNYCPRCQTDGKLLADRSLSRLLKADWPKTIEELEKLS